MVPVYARLASAPFVVCVDIVQGIMRARIFGLFLVLTSGVRAAEGVILLHGLARTSRSMSELEAALVAAGYAVVNVDYPSRVSSIGSLGEQVIGGALEDPRIRACSRVHFVAHSLGCILVRSYFAKRSDPRLGRVVMLGPPNQGSEVVDRLGSWRLFRWINGPAGSELGTGSESVPISLSAVRFELGVIAGDRSINWINSVMIPGPDDGKVAVNRTKVGGMKEHIVVHVSHPFLMTDRAVIAATLRFVESGSFKRQLTENAAEPAPRSGISSAAEERRQK
jgi:triacylglycerol lipase